MMLCTSLDVSKLARAVDVNVTTKITLPGGGLAKIDMKVPNTTDYGDAKDKPLWNGVVYIHDLASGTANNRKGVMLENGITLPTTTESTVARGGGLTVVTDHSAYIIGNYNTGGNPPVNSGAITDAATVAGYTVRPAAVMADAVNVLSRNWTIAYNSLSLGSRTPSSTTVNAALLSGNVPSTNPGGYSGGVENFPRLLEAWTSSIRLTIYGSMICLFPSIYATSRWGSSNVYDVPSRNWYFEPTFNNPNCLPPGTPNIVLFTNGEWVRLNN
ncbi:MAG: hypothetical protein IPP19_10320 [Verrucomicrobia bacterium]|nr:hypothetical protein [Verrucomicrobiota bacterium]